MMFLNFNPSGNWSTTLVALPYFSPSLYIVILYVIISPFSITTGSFLCLYVAVVPVCKVDSSIVGTLDSLPVKTLSFTFVIYFLSDKSKSLFAVVNVIGIDLISFSGITTGCAPLFVLEPHNVNFVLL